MNGMSLDRLVRSGASVLLSGALLLLTAPDLAAQEGQRRGRQDQVAVDDLIQLESQIQEREGRVLIGFKPVDARRGVTEDGRALLGAAEVESSLEQLGPELVRDVRRRFDLIPAVAAVIDPSTVEALLEDPRVDYVEPDYQVESQGEAPADAGAMDGAAAQSVPWGITRVQASAAWGITRGAGVSLGIIDSGIDADHPDLDPVGGVNVVTGGTSASDWDDDSEICHSHGTHVSGIAAALDDGAGVVGVAPAADLYAIRVFDPETEGFSFCGTLTSTVIDGIQWSVDNGMDVVNMSLGSGFPSVAEADALRVAYHNGVLPVAAAGNFGQSGWVIFPAAEPSAVAVSATTPTDGVAFFSSRGPEVEVAAPGLEVTSTTNDGGTGTLSGTSMASPHAAGTAALIRSAAPGLSVDEVRSLLQSTADDAGELTGHDETTGHGIVNAGRAATMAGGSELAVATVPERLVMGAPPAGAPDTTELVLRSVGEAGLVDWTVSTSAFWLSVSPDSGQVADGEPDTLAVVADPIELSSRVHRGALSLDGTASNQPVETRVQFTVARTLPLDSAQEVADSLTVSGERKRYALTADSAGQKVDVHVVPDGLSCAIARLYKPDGETVMDLSVGSRAAGVPVSPLMSAVTLPEVGTYLVEVGSTCSDVGSYIVKAREAGPILGLSPIGSPLLRAPEGGAADELTITVSNLSGIGSMGWTASADSAFLSISPGSGTADLSGEMLEPSTPAEEIDRLPLSRELRDQAKQKLEQQKSSSWGGLQPALREQARAAPDRFPAPVLLDDRQRQEVIAAAETNVTLTADPTGLTPGDRFAVVEFTTDNGWVRNFAGLPPHYFIQFRVFSSGMQIGSRRFDFAFDVAADPPAGTNRAVGTTGDFVGFEFVPTLSPVAADATVGSPVAEGFGSNAFGVATGPAGHWYLGSRVGGGQILELDRGGTVARSLAAPDFLDNLAIGPAGEIYVPQREVGIFRLRPGEDRLELWSPAVTYPFGLAYRPQDNSLYVSSSSPSSDGFQVGRIPLDSASVVADTLTGSGSWIDDLAVGGSGEVYGSTSLGRVDRFDPAQAKTPLETFFLPTSSVIWTGLTMLDGALAASGSFFGEFYTFPRTDSMVRVRPRLSADVASAPVLGVRGDSVEVTVRLNLTRSAEDVSSYGSTLGWPAPDTLTFVDVTAAEFGGSFQANTANAASGTLDASSSRSDSVAREAVGLYDVTFHVASHADPGSRYDFTLSFSQLQSSSGTDLTGNLTVEPAALCVNQHAFGDVDTDGGIDANDATQILLHVLERFTPKSASISLADVSNDGRVTAGDALQVLRSVVGLSIPGQSRVGEHGVVSCE